MGRRRWPAIAWGMFLTVLAAAPGTPRAQPAPGDTRGCCCVTRGASYTCTEKTQTECLADQPDAPSFPKLRDWKKAWSAAMKASETQVAKPLQGGWIADACEN